jgi:hypothetical protein
MNRVISFLTAVLFVLLLTPGQYPVTAQEKRPERPYPVTPEQRLAILKEASIRERPATALPLSPESPLEGTPQAYNFVSYVYCIYDFSVGWEIYTARNLDWRHEPTRLTYNTYTDILPRLRRSADRIAFMSDRDGNMEIYTMDIYGGDLRRLTHDEIWDGYPAWSPDGTQLLFVKQYDTKSDVYLMNQDGGDLRLLNPFQGWHFSPTWSPDGLWVAFIQAVSETHGRIIIMKADGSSAGALPVHLAYLDNLVWSPSGLQFGFEYDGDGDGWLDVGVINVDGTGLTKMAGQTQTEYWMGGWTPKEHMAGTRLFFNDQGYLNSANLFVWSGNFDHSSGPPWSFMPDVQSIDRTIPISAVQPLPPYTRGNQVNISWNGSDPGPAHIAMYRIENRKDTNSPWQYLTQAYYQYTTYAYNGQLGEKVYFRSQAVDWAENMEPLHSGDGDTFTQFYSLLLKGRFIDGRGHGLRGIVPLLSPTPFETAPSDFSGRFIRYLAAESSTLTASKIGYSSLPAIVISGNEDRQEWWTMGPVDNVIRNGSFELETNDWVPLSYLPGVIDQETSLSGQRSLLLGKPVLGKDPEIIPVPSDDSKMLSPRIVRDQEGNLHLVWSSSSKKISYRHSLQDGGWSQIKTLPRFFSHSFFDYVIDTTGTGHLIWLEDEDYYTSSLNYAILPPGGDWQIAPIPSPINTIVNNENSLPNLVLDSQDNLHMTFTDSFGLNYSFKEAGSTSWSTPYTIVSKTTHNSLTIDASDMVYVIYIDIPHIKMAARSPDGNWIPTETLPHELIILSPIKAAVDEHGVIHVGVLDWNGDEEVTIIKLISRTPAGIWSSQQSISLPCGWRFSLRAHLDGTAHLVCAHIPNVEGVFYSRYLSNGNWSKPLEVDALNILDLVPMPGTETILYWEDKSSVNISPVFLPLQGEISLSQKLHIPAQIHKPTLSLVHRLEAAGNGGQFQVLLNDTPVQTPMSSAEWTLSWIDVSGWAGQEVTLTLAVSYTNLWNTPFFRVDDVSLGSWKTPVVQGIDRPLHIHTGYSSLRLTILGENFMPTPEVWLGGKALLNPLLLDENTLQATLPPGMVPGLHELVVINPGGYDSALETPIRLGYAIAMPLVRR